MTDINMKENEAGTFEAPENEVAVVTYDNRHGGPFDRGSADSYYRRGIDPHYYVGNTGGSERVEKADMTEAEIEAYLAGYADNEACGCFKDWG